jgi:two-component system OmpR family response regulator
MQTVLVVDDEAHIREVVQYALEREGFRVLACGDGVAALRVLESGGVDLVVLDILMPELDGFSVCRRLRAGSNVPIIFLSSRGDEVDRILGLELGGDDYIPKPFSPRELTTRVKAVLRRSVPLESPRGERSREVLRHGALEVDRPRHEVRARNVRIDLTPTEFAVLAALLEQPGRLLSRAQLIERVCADDYHITERTIDTHVRRIRAKLRPHAVDPIETVHGLGYKASDPPA